MTNFKIGNLSVDPVAYGSQGNAILGIRGSGKTYTATFIAEKLFEAGVPFIAFDPIGVWRYLRIPGKGRGYPVVVAGGQEGDLPLTVASAPEIVRAAMLGGVSLVIDLFTIDLSKADWKRIVTSCVKVLLHENSRHGLRHIFIEEAAEFAPQRVGPDQGQVYAEIEKLARMGGNARLGYTLINQRAEEVNKAVLELCDSLFLHRQKGRNSLTALSKWLDVGNVKDAKTIINSMSSLPQGQCWAWMGETEEPVLIKVPAKNSLHPDRTIMRGATSTKLKSAVDVDKFVSAMKQNLVKIEAEAEANDPAKLRKQIADLQKQLKGKGAPVADPKLNEARLNAAHQEGYDAGVAAWGMAAESWQATLAQKVFHMIGGDKFKFGGAKKAPKFEITHIPTDRTTFVPLGKIKAAEMTNSVPTVRYEGYSEYSRAEQRIIDSMFFWLSVDQAQPSRPQVAAIAGYSVRSSGFEKLVSTLSTKGVLARPSPGLLTLNEDFKPQERHIMNKAQAGQKFGDILTPAQGRVLGAFADGASKRADIAERSGYSETSSGFEKTLSQLSSMGVVVRPQAGYVALSEWVKELRD